MVDENHTTQSIIKMLGQWEPFSIWSLVKSTGGILQTFSNLSVRYAKEGELLTGMLDNIVVQYLTLHKKKLLVLTFIISK